MLRKTGWRAGAHAADAGMKRHGGKSKPAGGMVWSDYVTECLSNDCVSVTDEAASATMPVGAPVLELVARARTKHHGEARLEVWCAWKLGDWFYLLIWLFSQGWIGLMDWIRLVCEGHRYGLGMTDVMIVSMCF